MPSLQPKISILIAVYNGIDHIERCLASIFAQSYDNIELIVIDGGSDDGTANYLRSIEDQLSYWLSEPDTGIYNAWNKALSAHTGDWVLFLGSDDRLHDEQAIQRMASTLQDACPPYRVVYGKIDVVTIKGEVLRTWGEPWEIAGNKFNELMTLPHPGTFQHTSLFKEQGVFDEQFRIVGDYEFLLRELMHNEALFVDTPVTCMQAGGVSDDSRHGWLHIRERFLARKKNRIGGIPLLLLRQAIGELFFQAVRSIGGDSLSATIRGRYRALRQFLLFRGKA